MFLAISYYLLSTYQTVYVPTLSPSLTKEPAIYKYYYIRVYCTVLQTKIAIILTVYFSIVITVDSWPKVICIAWP
jgi:hypothetical protein